MRPVRAFRAPPPLLVILAGVLFAVGCTASAKPVATTASDTAGAVATSDRERYAREARWAPGQLEAHFRKHPDGYRTQQEYDQGARDVIRRGTAFSYRDLASKEIRLGFYEREGNRFTSLTRDGRRITTHFRPDRGESYVRGLQESTYR